VLPCGLPDWRTGRRVDAADGAPCPCDGVCGGGRGYPAAVTHRPRSALGATHAGGWLGTLGTGVEAHGAMGGEHR